MTGMLRSVLREHADATDSPVLDLDAIIRTGDRRVRGRRLGAALAATVVGVVGAASALVVPGLGADDGLAAAPTAAFAERKVGYALDETIHWGNRSFNVGTTVASYVQTDDGFVFTTPTDGVWLYDGRTSERIGDAVGGRLEADTDGSLVAWRESTPEPEYIVFDTAARHEIVRVPAPKDAQVYALDDGSAYWRTGEGIARFEIASGTSHRLWRWSDVADPSSKKKTLTGLVDVAAERFAYTVDGMEWGLRVARELDLEVPPLAQATFGALSPDGRFLAAEERDNIAVYDTTTGSAVTPDLTQYPFAVAYAWLDEQTAMVFALESVGDSATHTADFLACRVPSGDCTVIGSDRVTERIVLPIGMPAT